MNKIWIIARKDISEAFRSRSLYAFIFVMLILTLTYVTSYNRGVKVFTSPQAIDDFSRSFLNGLSYILPMTYSIFVCSIFANYSVIVDKAKRNIESLMATPVSIQQIWMGKSLAVALPSLVLGLAISILVYLVMNFAFVIPKTHTFIFPDAMALVSAIIIIPVLVFAIVTIVIHIQLVISNPRIGNFVFTGIFVLLILSIDTAPALGITFNYFPLIYLGAAAVCGLVSLFLSRYLTKEKVLLSSKA